MTYFSYTFSGDTIVRTFNAYSFTGDAESNRYTGVTPPNVAEEVWVYPPYARAGGGDHAGGGGISIYTTSE